ncbi:choice-of-anchor U domain-containing protein [uncultured Cocleimonas sp.]|uniref:DUF7933 domain-containing protein n=1 Tax=uncultured Cocleimonas sp. TaxID=1051587 RepID=UPI00260AD4D4|nr:choice-of-anchor U domain-containing protein [uncultured Cocleimonas sp.]
MLQVSKEAFGKNLLVLLLLIASFSVAHSAYAGVSVPILTKQFSPATIGPGSVSTLTLTIDNSNAPIPALDLAFTDPLPAGVTIADPANASTSCLNGILDAPNSGSAIAYSDGVVAANASCVVSVDVTSSTPGIHTNTSGDLTSSAGNSGSAIADLNVVTTLPGFSKSFSPDSVSLGGRSTLTFTIDNTAGASRVGFLDFTDNLPAGMIVADPANVSTDCISASAPNTTVTATQGSSVVTLDANGSNFVNGLEVLPIGATCTVTVDVTASGSGVLNNVSGDLLADFTSAGNASASLTVTTTPLSIQKSFVNDPVAPGGIVNLDFILNNFDRNSTTTGIAFTDDLGAALTGLSFESLLSNDCGGSVTGAGTSSIGFSGGTVAAGGSCTISTSLSIPAGAAPGAYTNITSTITGTVDGSTVTGNTASEVLFVAPTPLLTKEFLDADTLAPDPVVNAGDDVVLRFSITNPSTTSAATDIEFLDELTDGSGGTPPDLTSGFLPFPVVSVTTLPANGICGSGSSVVMTSVGGDRQGLQLTGGSLAVGETCTFDVTLTIPVDLSPGIYTNTTEEPTATIDGATRTGKAASDTLTVIGAPSLTKVFGDDPATPGGTVTLEFTLSHPADASGDATDISFTDNLMDDLVPALNGLTATGLPLTAACVPDGAGENPGTGTLSATAGDTLLTLMGASLSPGESCTISVTLNVPVDAAAGTYTNTSSGVMATVGGLAATSAPASDDLKISGIKFTKEFLSNPVLPGATTTLRFSIENLHPTDDATALSFFDNLGGALSGLTATGVATADSCGGTLSGTTFLIYTGGSVLSGETCTIEVPVLVPAGAANGDYSNVTDVLSATVGGTAETVQPATDTLTVNSDLIQLEKSFADDLVAPGGSVILQFTLTNLDPTQAASAIAFTDNLDSMLSGLVATGVIANGCGGTVNVGGTIAFTGGVLAVGTTDCQIDVTVDIPATATPNIYTNTTSSVTGVIDSLAVTGSAASDNLEIINLLQFSKSFDGPSTATGTATLTFTISNPGTSAASGISFTDDLESVLSGLVATSLPAMPCGAGSSITGTSLLAFTGGELPPMDGMCSFDVEVTLPDVEDTGSFANTTSDLSINGLFVSPPATADLIVEPAPTFNKAFAPDTVALNGPNTVSTLTFTIDNSASALLAASALDFTDSLPAGLVIVTPSNASTTCTGGTVTAASGASIISYTGGSVGVASSCTISVDVINTTIGDKVNTSGDLTSSSGNSGTATDTLMVDAPPVITAPADIPAFQATGVTSAVMLGTPVINDDIDAGLTATPSPDGSSLPLGTTPITWTVTDGIGNISTTIQSVTVVDTLAPVITLLPQQIITLEATANQTPVTISATVTDAVSSGLTAIPSTTGPFPVGTTIVTWSVTDGANNTSTAMQTVTIADTTPPVITLNGSSTVSLDFGGAFTDDGAIASDIVDGDLTSSIIPSGTVGTAPGSYILTYSVTDNANNTSSVTRTVIIGAVRTFSSLLPSGETGTLTFTSTNVESGCTFNTSNQAYFDVSGATITPPSVLSFVDGLITFEIINCAVGETVVVTMDYGQPLPANAAYWKEGTPWFQIPSTISGNTVSFSITDGGIGDADGNANGTIVDPGGLAVLSGAQSIPTLSNWALMILIMLMLGSMTYYQRRRKY